MDFGYHHHRIISEAQQIELRERHLHARLLMEARAADTPPRLSLIARMRAALLRRPSGRGNAAGATGRIPATLAAAAIAVPAVGLDTDMGPIDPVASDPAAAKVLELTGSACRLPDGSPGRIAIERISDEEWVAICVGAPSGPEVSR
jgi:hypothetical protein